MSLPVNEFENRLTFEEVMGKSLVSCFFWDTVYIEPNQPVYTALQRHER